MLIHILSELAHKKAQRFPIYITYKSHTLLTKMNELKCPIFTFVQGKLSL